MSTKDKVNERKFLYKKVPQIKEYRHIYANSKNEIYACDLADYSHENGINKGYILVCVDVYTRYLMTAVLKTKSKNEIEKALLKMFHDYGQCKAIHSDKESALIHSKMLKDMGIEVYHTEHTEADKVSGSSPIAERTIQTIRGWLQQYSDVTMMKQWKIHVDEVTDDFNHKVHSTTKMKPNDAFWNSDTKQIDQNTTERLVEDHERDIKTDPKLVEDTNVVIPRHKKTFEKGYTQRWESDVLQIVEVLNTKPVSYRLSNGMIAYKEHLQALSDSNVKTLTTKVPKPKKAKAIVETDDEPISSRVRSKTMYPNMFQNKVK
jgi:hypothetical protein